MWLNLDTQGSSELFVTCSSNAIRIWHTPTGSQLLHINVPSATCNTVVLRPDGKLILSGWYGLLLAMEHFLISKLISASGTMERLEPTCRNPASSSLRSTTRTTKG